MITLPHFKVCVSSRPWNAFQDAFGRCIATLRVQDMTYRDIERYTQNQLESHPRYQKLCQREPSRAPELLSEISAKASGVFLWVFLVVRSLKDGLTNGDRIVDLQRRVDRLPGDLEEYFLQILNSVNDFYMHQASGFFLYALESEEPFTLQTFSLLQEEEADFGANAPVKPISIEYAQEVCDETERRLSSRCKGLLEVYGNNRNSALADSLDPGGQEQYRKVGFLHRTVRDFLQAPKVLSRLEVHGAPSELDRCRVLLQATVAQVKILRVTRSSSTNLAAVSYLISQVVPVLKKFGKTSPFGEVALLDEFDRSVSDYRTRAAVFEYNDRHVKHWTDFWMRSDAPHSFLAFAVSFGLTSYVREKLELQSLRSLHGWSRSLLEYALLPNELAERSLQPNIDMIKLLLDHGEQVYDIDDIIKQWKRLPKHKQPRDVIELVSQHSVSSRRANLSDPVAESNSRSNARRMLDAAKLEKQKQARQRQVRQRIAYLRMMKRLRRHSQDVSWAVPGGSIAPQSPSSHWIDPTDATSIDFLYRIDAQPEDIPVDGQGEGPIAQLGWNFLSGGL